MTQYLHIVMSLGGEEYTPELNDDQMTDIAVLAGDVFSGELLGDFVRAASIDYAKGKFEDITDNVLELIEANRRKAA